jgi:hypothetical protein
MPAQVQLFGRSPDALEPRRRIHRKEGEACESWLTTTPLPREEVPPGTLNSILRQAGLKGGAP